MSNETDEPSQGPFKYHLELTPAQLKITHTALRSLLDDFGHEQSDVHGVIREVLDKLPDEHAMRAIRLDSELQRALEGDDGAPAVLDQEPEDQAGASGPQAVRDLDPENGPPDSVA